MKTFIALGLLIGLITSSASGQGAQADMIKRRAKEVSNQNNVRQGVPPPTQPQPRSVAPPQAKPGTNAVTQVSIVTKLKNDLAVFKTGTPVKPEQKQQLTTDLTAAARGTKPSAAAVKKFVDSLTAALPEATLTAEHHTRLAQNLDGVMNAKLFPAKQFDLIIEDVQAILEVGTVKRATAMSVAADLKAIGAEVRR
ncbi:MAG: hypothetical protein AAB370_07575 [Verrucomicrobiota bacterium]